jgi:hypothetical protein
MVLRVQELSLGARAIIEDGSPSLNIWLCLCEYAEAYVKRAYVAYTGDIWLRFSSTRGVYWRRWEVESDWTI